mmetsp:Transcript_34294/g.67425  ORF Transcript_34294/g.67425 Transcript_34294/m.67425 type:complete len:96 (+) Transcript_34294:12-299(+)
MYITITRFLHCICSFLILKSFFTPNFMKIYATHFSTSYHDNLDSVSYFVVVQIALIIASRFSCSICKVLTAYSRASLAAFGPYAILARASKISES